MTKRYVKKHFKDTIKLSDNVLAAKEINLHLFQEKRKNILEGKQEDLVFVRTWQDMAHRLSSYYSFGQFFHEKKPEPRISYFSCH